MKADIDRILIDEAAIAARLDRLAADIHADFSAPGDPLGDDGHVLTLVPILTGSFIFTADLIRRLPLPMQIYPISVTSYPGTTTRSRPDEIRHELMGLPESLAGRRVLVVDDILDSGRTLALVTRLLAERSPEALRSCVLLRKERDEPRNTQVDYAAFDIPDEFVVGYGLDYDNYYRNLPEICTLKPAVYAEASA